MKIQLFLYIFFAFFWVTFDVVAMNQEYQKKFDTLLEQVKEEPTLETQEQLLSEFIKQRGFQINFQNQNKQTLLHIAAALGLERIVNQLLSVNAKIQQDSAGNTFLHLLMMPEQEDYSTKGSIRAPVTKLKTFFESLSNIDVNMAKKILNTPNNQGSTPFLLLVDSRNNFYDQNIIDLLVRIINVALEMGANPNLQSDTGDTALILAFKNNFSEIIPLLLEKGANLYFKTIDGKNIFHIAAEEHSPELLKIAFSAIKDPLIRKAMNNAQDNFGNTPLNLAIDDTLQSLETILYLLKIGKADPNIPNKDGFTPLHKAIAIRNYQLVEELLNYGANPSLRTNLEMDTPLEMEEKIHSAEIKTYDLEKKLIEKLNDSSKKQEKFKKLNEKKDILGLLQTASHNFPAPTKKEVPQPRKKPVTQSRPLPLRDNENNLNQVLQELKIKLQILDQKLGV